MSAKKIVSVSDVVAIGFLLFFCCEMKIKKIHVCCTIFLKMAHSRQQRNFSKVIIMIISRKATTFDWQKKIIKKRNMYFIITCLLKAYVQQRGRTKFSCNLIGANKICSPGSRSLVYSLVNKMCSSRTKQKKNNRSQSRFERALYWSQAFSLRAFTYLTKAKHLKNHKAYDLKFIWQHALAYFMISLTTARGARGPEPLGPLQLLRTDKFHNF